MPEFSPGEAKTAVAPITVSPAGLSCEAEVFLGPDELTKVATSGRIPFTSTGLSQDARLPVTMPDAEGAYHVFIDVYAEGVLIAAYQATEDVVIVGVARIETLRPNAPGDMTNIPSQYPATGAHWDKVDEVIADGNATYVYAANRDDWVSIDLYKLPSPTGSGSINKITVYACCLRGKTGVARHVIKSHGVVSEHKFSVSKYAYTLYPWALATNPATGQPWTWNDIENLQIGVSLNPDGRESIRWVRCTQVYVEIDYIE